MTDDEIMKRLAEGSRQFAAIEAQMGEVLAADTVKYFYRNSTAAPIDLASHTVRVNVRKA